MTTAVSLRGVGFVYPDGTRALDGITLDVAEGDAVAIVGQNGSGKSTLARHLNGLLRPTEGEVLLFDRPTTGRHVAELARTVGLAFQDPDRQVFAGSVRAEVAFGARNLGRRGGTLDEAVARALAAVGLDGEAATNPYDLGHSRRKLLSLASILAMDTPVVVLDEPTTGQDARGVGRVRGIVAGLAATGRTVIAISHDMGFVAGSFERAIVMRAGRVILDGDPAAVFGGVNAVALTSTFLEAPLATRLGERLGLGTTPTETAFLAALEAFEGAEEAEEAGPAAGG